VSNPPYVRESERVLMQINVLEHEPPEALFVPDADPLLYYRSIARLGTAILNGSGTVWVEINEKLGRETASLFSSQGYRQVEVIKDIHEKERFIKACRPQP
jgi:release factor glutamine methyltransferase